MAQSPSDVFPPESADEFKFPSRRSVVHSTEGIVATTQPLAAKCGIDVLHAGGNAADAAVAVAAGMNMTEPCSTGIGGDMFLLYWDAASKTVKALNGSGRSPANATLAEIREDIRAGPNDSIPLSSAHSVTVPGAAAGWVDVVERFGSGKLTLKEILAPAVRLGEKGFPVSEIAAASWQGSEKLLRTASPNGAEMLKADPNAENGVRAPRAGELMKNPTLAATFRSLADHGKAGFYTGRIAEEIVSVVGSLGGKLSLDDLRHHMDMGSEPVDPISLKFTGQGLGQKKGVELWEHPPNGQGIVALMALGIIQELEKTGKIGKFGVDDAGKTAYLHVLIESLRLAFSDAQWYVSDPNVVKVPTEDLISARYLAERAKLFDPKKALGQIEPGEANFVSPALRSSDTVYFTVTDKDGNAASFINSNYQGFGTGIIPKGCGMTLQNRGSNFSLDENHPNKFEPRKRPYHTIIPGMVTTLPSDSSPSALHSAFGVMGGYMQPQGHIQVLLNQALFGLNPQQALDAPRICIGAGMTADGGGMKWTVHVEDGIHEHVVRELEALGHHVKVLRGSQRGMFGRGQVIRWTVDRVERAGIWSGGSDMRGDGAAYPA